MSEQNCEPLNQTEVEDALEFVRSQIAGRKLGVSLVTDYNGAWGQAGATYLTLRGTLKGDHMEVTFQLLRIQNVDLDRREQDERECPK